MSDDQPKSAAEETVNGAELLADLLTGRKTIRGVINEELEKFFGPERGAVDMPASSANPPADKPQLASIAGGKK